MNHGHQPNQLQHLIEHFARIAEFAQGLPGEDSPINMLTREFLLNNLASCKERLLSKTRRIRARAWPDDSLFPATIKFEVDVQYKAKPSRESPVEMVQGPLRGTVYYRPDMFVNHQDPAVAVALDPDQAFFHPNYSRQQGFLCLGELPESPYPFPLELLLENIIFPIVSYQIRRPVHPFDLEAAQYFALDPNAMQGLEDVEPLY